MESINKQKSGFFGQGWVRAIGLLVAFLLANLLLGLVLGMVLMGMHAEEIKNKTFSLQDTLQGPLRPLIVLLTTVISFLLVWLFTKFWDKRSFKSVGFAWDGYANQAAAGFFLPFAMLGTGTLILFYTKYLSWTDIHFDATLVFINVGTMLLVAFGEEIIFRGYVLNNLMQSLSRRMALIVSALLFATFHMASPGASVLPLINVFIAGLLLGVVYSHTHNLWFGIAFHFTWNFFQGPILGYKVSGKAFGSLFEQELQGPEWLTGGAFGFEGSILCTILTVVALVCLELLFTASAKENASKEMDMAQEAF